MDRQGRELVKILQDEHRAILQRLEEIRGAGVNTPIGRRALVDFRPVLYAHLDLEDDELYPLLRSASSHDPELDRRLDAFVGGMEAITGLARDLLDGFDGQQSDAPESLAAGLEQVAVFERFFAALRHRIQEEEAVLYREYLRVASQGDVRDTSQSETRNTTVPGRD